MSKTGNIRRSQSARARIRILMNMGYAASKIAKETGISYAHVKQIVEQERAAQQPTQPEGE